jgi:hypothetical protein
VWVGGILKAFEPRKAWLAAPSFFYLMSLPVHGYDKCPISRGTRRMVAALLALICVLLPEVFLPWLQFVHLNWTEECTAHVF